MWLTVFSGPKPERTVEVTGRRFLIGREEDCDLIITDPKVSHQHAEIVPLAGPFRVIRDLGSANGTLVNGRPLKTSIGFTAGDVKEAKLTGGEWLHFGDTPVRVSLMDPRLEADRTPSGSPDAESD
jgi:pSer/pThr/pTyr-binding forkhead associated (FHA) protein